jgi:hypothetical protein
VLAVKRFSSAIRRPLIELKAPAADCDALVIDGFGWHRVYYSEAIMARPGGGAVLRDGVLGRQTLDVVDFDGWTYSTYCPSSIYFSGSACVLSLQCTSLMHYDIGVRQP